MLAAARRKAADELEIIKILGKFDGDKIKSAKIIVSASCNTVNVKGGHLECVFVELEKKPSIEEVREVFKNFRGEPQHLNLPSAPKNPITVRNEKDGP
jgi:aspartate-semialdehyde dehydrogenase